MYIDIYIMYPRCWTLDTRFRILGARAGFWIPDFAQNWLHHACAPPAGIPKTKLWIPDSAFRTPAK